jgi:hypothetical protein
MPAEESNDERQQAQKIAVFKGAQSDGVDYFRGAWIEMGSTFE